MPASMATSTRDRLPQVPSQSAQSSPMRSSAQANKTQLLSVDALLDLHCTSADPKLAALDHAVSDRNSLSAQNAQLWKLIEKQRVGYNAIMKENERLRNERDALKLRLGGSFVPPAERRHRSQERDRQPRKPSEDSSVESSNGTPERQPLDRAYSDDLRMCYSDYFIRNELNSDIPSS